MKNEDFFNKGLPKWPAMVVLGKPITKEQAAEIIIRTDSLWFGTNDRQFQRELESFFFDVQFTSYSRESVEDAIKRKLGIPEGETNWLKIWEYKGKAEEGVKKIPLEYLHNYRIVSSWVGGPHGWCNWDGSIFCNNYNIGKWPSVEDVYNEWKSIAKEFPFLELRCQLMGHENGYSETGVDEPVIEFVVKNGKVKMVEPKQPLSPTNNGIDEDAFSRLFAPGGERGCTLEQFKRSVTQVRQKYSKETV